ncbi:DNA repair helicase [Microbispora triticiradicis]|uniref:DNA repair helicase n=1 Tax=Microbispora triticiradicis TaxID=2200763 RepID=A0ABX9LQB4_9ACTN|nr:DEAD/DEAH box helicase family protein [Microbispora triticiradicis]RGA06207.1 DNA repair helicase [Microbispora triticiradicis]GLW23498.1 DNA-repair protein [Microbispora amethystogenes]
MSLPGVPINDSYRSDTGDLARDFYVPVLAEAVQYDRAVGYFTSASLELVAQGIDRLRARGGRIRLVASPLLSPDDVEDIRRGYEYRAVVARAVAREIDPETLTTRAAERLGTLGKLIAEGVLEIKIAVVAGTDGLGIYHEKIGIVTDQQGNSVAFTGSLNETRAAMENNFESIEVFLSWVPGDARRVRRITENFTALWEGKTERLEVLEFPKEAEERLRELATQVSRSKSSTSAHRTSPLPSEQASNHGWATTPEGIELRDYQKEAITRWLRAGARGIFEMATGTGKTITALAALDQIGRQLRTRSSSLVTVIVVPLLDLVEQWSGELNRFGIVPVKCRDSVGTWQAQANNAIAGLRPGRAVTLVVTNRTYGSPAFQNLLSSVGGELLIIADEVHHLGAEHHRFKLPIHAPWRLALSATPERWFDDEGTEALRDYFGEALISLGLRDAIEMGALTPYRYCPVLVPLTDEEAAYYTVLTGDIGALYGQIKGGKGRSREDAEARLGQLLNKRAKVLGHASGKVCALQKEVSKRHHLPAQLVYCAEGARPQEDDPVGEESQIDQVVDLLGNRLGMRVHTYTSQEPKQQRREILEAFGSGDLEALISMRCLDEGVDLPDARIAYMLASSSNPRQFIQRRGRILRRAPGKTEAEVIDFIAVPPQYQELFETERRLFRREMHRFVEFAKYSNNYGAALSELRDLREYYELMDV